MNMADLSILWSLTFLAIMVAINARGPIRIGFSWLFTVVILVIAIFISSMKFSEVKSQLFDSEPTPEAPSLSAAPTKVAPAAKPAAKSALDPETQARDYINAATPMVSSALNCARSILSVDLHNLQSLNDTQYEREQSRALSLRNQSGTINRQIKSLQAPVQYKTVHAEIDKAAENLRLAGWAVHAYFSAENSDEEATRQNTAINNAQAALNTLRAVQQQLK